MSQRLITIADMLKDEGRNRPFTVADIGCDHGYVSIYLVQQQIADSCIAMDVRKGPLSGATDNIAEFGLSGRITTRLSDGLTALLPGEADAIVVAGMGGKLMLRILEEGKVSDLGIKEAILQPQSDLQEFRETIRAWGFYIQDEKILLDEGKYYFPMKVVFGGSCSQSEAGIDRAVMALTNAGLCPQEQAIRVCNRFGEYNILRKEALLKDFCLHGQQVCRSILAGLDSQAHANRYRQVESELCDIEVVLQYFEKE